MQKIDVRVNKGCIVNAPAECLIEDYQSLVRAIIEQDWDAVETVASCLATVISNHMSVPAGLGLKFEPGPMSCLLMSHDEGILSLPDGSDIECLAGHGISTRNIGGTPQCPDDCPHLKAGVCDCDLNELSLSTGGIYYGDATLDTPLFNIVGTVQA